MKKFLAAILCLVLAALALAGCGTKEPEAAEPVKIKICYPISRGMEENSVTEFREWFQNSFPNAELELVSASATTITDTVHSDLKSEEGPDIFVTTEYDSFIYEGLLTDITGIEALAKYRKSSVRELERNNKVYALPIGGGTLIALHYNKALFEQYGLEEPSEQETFLELLARIRTCIDENDLDVRPISASLLYPAQASVIMNSLLVSENQKTDYLKWIVEYKAESGTFKDSVFQNYLDQMELLIKARSKEDTPEGQPYLGKVFSNDDYVNTQAGAISAFLAGNSFLYIGDVKRCYDSLDQEGIYGSEDICVMGIPTGKEGISYVSYMDDMYMGINANYAEQSEEKKRIIREILNYVSDNSAARDIFTFTGEYSSIYLEDQSTTSIDEPYFEKLNICISRNYIAQGISNTAFSRMFGKTILAWKNGKLADAADGGTTDQEMVTNILERYRTKHVDAFALSDEPIGNCSTLMEYQSNLVRTQETALANQVADMARDYMQADFALINAGAIRASIPEGAVSVQTLQSVLPYDNYLVKIRISGATLKQALANAYNVGPGYKSGQFGAISGLQVVVRTKEAGYQKFADQLKAWQNANTNATDAKKNTAIRDIVAQMEAEEAGQLNLELVSVKDLSGKEIEDDKIYTLATFDYLLKNQDGYSMLGILSDCKEADRTIELLAKDGSVISGSADEMLEAVKSEYEAGAASFANWVQAGGKLESKIDGRLKVQNMIYIE